MSETLTELSDAAERGEKASSAGATDRALAMLAVVLVGARPLSSWSLSAASVEVWEPQSPAAGRRVVILGIDGEQKRAHLLAAASS